MLEVLERICRMEGNSDDLALMRNIGENMQAGSLCGHGQLGFNPVASALRYFPEQFETHIVDKRCPTGRCHVPHFSPQRSRR
jgi:NADH-quinone oxidoreductase subunit F